jgi:hypothetical protein
MIIRNKKGDKAVKRRRIIDANQLNAELIYQTREIALNKKNNEQEKKKRLAQVD